MSTFPAERRVRAVYGKTRLNPYQDIPQPKKRRSMAIVPLIVVSYTLKTLDTAPNRMRN